DERMGNKKVIAMMAHDGLTCSLKGVHMGTNGSKTPDEFEVTREEQDNWSYQSQQRAIAATQSGKLKEESVAVDVPKRKGDSVVVDTDEAPRKDTTVEKLRSLRPAFDKDGTVTAGNAPGVNDGACAFVVM